MKKKIEDFIKQLLDKLSGIGKSTDTKSLAKSLPKGVNKDLAKDYASQIKDINYEDLVRKYLGKRSPKKTVLFVGDRPMIYPYTFTAKVMQFPYAYYFHNNWNYRYYIFGIIASLPVFFYINGLANSPDNVAKWREIRRKEAMEGHHH